MEAIRPPAEIRKTIHRKTITNNNNGEPQNPPVETFYDVVYSAGEGGSIQGAANQRVKEGENATSVTAVANEGYEFTAWSDGKTTVTRQDTSVMATANYQASFCRISYTLQYTAGEGGSISGSSTQIVEYGENATAVTAVPNTGYEFVAWNDGKNAITRQESNIKASANYLATFRRISYTLQYTAGDGGSISGNLTQSVEYGGNGLSVTAIPDDGFEFIGWNDGVISATRQETEVKNNKAVQAFFARKTFSLCYVAENGGTIQGDTNQTVNYDAGGISVVAFPNEGYEFVRWSDGLTTEIRQDVNIKENKTIQALFAIKTFSLKYEAEDGGTIQGSTSQIVDYNANGVAVTAVPEEGYEFVRWSDGVLTATRQELEIKRSFSTIAFFRKVLSALQGDGTIESPYIILSKEELFSVELAPSACFSIGKDIVLDEALAGQSNFWALCSEDVPFNGKLDGCNHIIKNLTIVCGESDFFIGLFKCLGDGAVICNLTLDNLSLVGSNYVGSIAGKAGEHVLVNNCHTNGHIVAVYKNSFAGSVGGLLGACEPAITLSNSSNACSIIVNDRNDRREIGGLVGRCKGSVYVGNNYIVDCYNSGEIDATFDAGGLFGSLGSYSQVIKCYNNGSVQGFIGGGIVGSYSTNVSFYACFNKGAVAGEAGAGGLLGRGNGSANLSNCYNWGTVFSVSQSAGGLVYNSGPQSISIYKCYNSGIVSSNSVTGMVLGQGSLSGEKAFWVDHEVDINYGIGRLDTTGVPSNLGTIRISKNSDFSELVDSLNEGDDESIWELIENNALPTLIYKKEEKV